MNKTDKAQIATDYNKMREYGNQLSNFVYNVIQRDEGKAHAEVMGPVVRQYDATRQKLNETLKRHGILKD
jgi:hypothetical protein